MHKLNKQVRSGHSYYSSIIFVSHVTQRQCQAINKSCHCYEWSNYFLNDITLPQFFIPAISSQSLMSACFCLIGCGKCSVVSELRRMGGSPVQLVGLTIPDTSRMSEVSFELGGLASEGLVAEDPLKFDQRIVSIYFHWRLI